MRHAGLDGLLERMLIVERPRKFKLVQASIAP